MRRHLNGSHAGRADAGAALSFVSFIPLFGGVLMTYLPMTPIVFSQVSTSSGHSVMGDSVRRRPNA